MIKRILGSACSLLLIAGAGQAQVFIDDFSGDATGLGKTSLSKWNVTAGNVDVVGPGLFDLYPGNGSHIDLDGTGSGVAPIMQNNTNLTLLAGQEYTLSFNWGRNGNNAEQATVSLLNSSFGGSLLTFPAGGPSPFLLASFTFTQGATVNNARIQFAQQTLPDGGGIVIDNVSLVATPAAAAPEPTTVALISLAGAPLLGLLRRKKAH